MPSRMKRVTGSTVRVAALTNYVEVVRSLGVNPLPLLRQAGISQVMLNNPDQHLASDTVADLLEETARLTDCDSIGLRMAESRQLSNFGAVSLLISHQRTLGDMLHTITRYRHILNEALALEVDQLGPTTIVREEVLTSLPRASRQSTELAVGVLFGICKSFLGLHWQPQSVNFAHPAPRDASVHRRVFRCKLVFNSEFNGFVCSTAELETRNPLADPVMARYAERFVEHMDQGRADSIPHQVRKMVYLLLPLGRATITQVAQGLGMQVRTLQRRLDLEQEPFSGLLDGVRRDLVLRYVENPAYSLGHVAELLGYGSQSSFTRWFIAQYGRTPSEWRAQSLPKPRARRTATRPKKSPPDSRRAG